MLPFLVTPCLVVAVQPCMERIPIKKKKKKNMRPEGHQEPCNEVGYLSPVKQLVGFEPGTF